MPNADESLGRLWQFYAGTVVAATTALFGLFVYLFILHLEVTTLAHEAEVRAIVVYSELRALCVEVERLNEGQTGQEQLPIPCTELSKIFELVESKLSGGDV